MEIILYKVNENKK